MMRTNRAEYDPWWRLSGRTWCVLAACALASIACTAEPTLIEKTLWLADFRQWPWWYFVILLIVIGFSVQWYAIDDADVPGVKAARYVRLTGTISVLLFLVAVFHRSGRLRFSYNALYSWFGLGSFSFAALFAFVFVLSASILLVAFTWQWIQSWEE